MRIRHFDWFLAVCFAFFAIGSAIADIPSALGIEASPTSPNPFGRIAYAYAAG